ncbi:sialidase family protein [Flavilitoribacter nigricans]|uniref:exo-alpha-sialidase n=1 Tax=Flavilitoribacter nigricans (strain ATCC 23147 / DSM 23189 / NBRC 102662 / NCIMB 1420 / SS-2) TaxID=1122177 RepID=A0A2D0NC36_FLAN2|nr:sialidase family protein [Flavilitoribacter nigricans]PHN05920.1 glycosyl hydrolase [Flavilitoribacter nigricans DSM 23189 = NBRC 102662]
MNKINLRFAMPAIVYCLIFLASALPVSAQKMNAATLWTKGTGDYNNYRIPALIVTTRGSVLAFCEGREAGDTGDINLLLKRSTDHGKTWSDERIIWDDGNNTCGNPCPVIDETTGRIYLFMTWNLGSDHESDIILKKSEDTRHPYVCYSDDDGLTWSSPVDLSESCKDPAWGWYATGPGVGIQIKNGPHRGRLVIPANHSYDDPNGKIRGGPYGYGAHVLLSDDHGRSWRKSASIRPGCNESQVVELSDGTLMMNMRSYNDKYARASAISTDGGESWSEIKHELQLVESKCQAGILNFGKYKGKELILFSNPAVPVGRTHMTVKSSLDDAQTWTSAKLIFPGPAAYSSLTRLANGRVGLFFENGDKGAYDQMLFISFPPKLLFSDVDLSDLITDRQ